MASSTVSSFGIKFHFLVSVLFLLCQYNLGASAEYFCPTTNISSYVKFQLYSRDIPDGVDLDLHNNLTFSELKTDKPTKIITHGFRTPAGRTLATTLIIDAFRQFTDSNIILLDWSTFSGREIKDLSGVITCAQNSLAPFIARFVNYLVEQGVPQDSIHLIGHSLGAHAMGLAGRHLGFRLPRITGLDPAGGLFNHLFKGKQLNKTDAIVVDVIHSNSLGLGTKGPDGTFDFYVDGGSHQRGCAENSVSQHTGSNKDLLMKVNLCNHFRSYQLYAASINPANKFPSVMCKTRMEARVNICLGEVASAGYYLENTKPGIYATSTKGYTFDNIYSG